MSEGLLGRLLIAAGGYFFVLKPILEKFGLKKSEEDKKAEEAAKEAEDRKNDKQPLPDKWEPQSFNAWQVQSIYNLDKYVNRMNQSLVYKGKKLKDGAWRAPLYSVLPNNIAETIYDNSGFFTRSKTAWLTFDGKIRECPTKLCVAYVCKVYKEKYGVDLKTFLDNEAKGLHWFDDGKDILAGINKYVDNLPVGLFWLTANNQLKLAL